MRLSAIAVGRNNHPAGDLVSNHAAKALTNDIQAAVQRGGSACGSDDIAVIHVEGIDIQPDVREERLKLAFELPVGGRTFAVEDPRISQHKRPQTQPDDLRAVISCSYQAVKQRLRRAFKDMLPVGNDDNIGLSDGGVVLRSIEGKSVF